ncbi:hypothetical protein EG861_14480, partial [Enterococcus faecalis]
DTVPTTSAPVPAHRPLQPPAARGPDRSTASRPLGLAASQGLGKGDGGGSGLAPCQKRWEDRGGDWGWQGAKVGGGLGLAGCQGRRGIGVGRVPSMWFGKVPEYKLAFCQFSVSAHPPPPPHSPQWKTRGRENFFSQIRARGRAGP